jgi:hypothetical protein
MRSLIGSSSIRMIEELSLGLKEEEMMKLELTVTNTMEINLMRMKKRIFKYSKIKEIKGIKINSSLKSNNNNNNNNLRNLIRNLNQMELFLESR